MHRQQKGHREPRSRSRDRNRRQRELRRRRQQQQQQQNRGGGHTRKNKNKRYVVSLEGGRGGGGGRSLDNRRRQQQRRQAEQERHPTAASNSFEELMQQQKRARPPAKPAIPGKKAPADGVIIIQDDPLEYLKHLSFHTISIRALFEAAVQPDDDLRQQNQLRFAAGENPLDKLANQMTNIQREIENAVPKEDHGEMVVYTTRYQRLARIFSGLSKLEADMAVSTKKNSLNHLFDLEEATPMVMAEVRQELKKKKDDVVKALHHQRSPGEMRKVCHKLKSAQMKVAQSERIKRLVDMHRVAIQGFNHTQLRYYFMAQKLAGCRPTRPASVHRRPFHEKRKDDDDDDERRNEMTRSKGASRSRDRPSRRRATDEKLDKWKSVSGKRKKQLFDDEEVDHDLSKDIEKRRRSPTRRQHDHANIDDDQPKRTSPGRHRDRVHIEDDGDRIAPKEIRRRPAARRRGRRHGHVDNDDGDDKPAKDDEEHEPRRRRHGHVDDTDVPAPKDSEDKRARQQRDHVDNEDRWRSVSGDRKRRRRKDKKKGQTPT